MADPIIDAYLAASSSPSTGDPLADELRRQMERRATSGMFTGGSPDDAATALDMARRLGLPPDTVARNRQAAQREIHLRDAKGAMRSYPVIARWATDPENAAISSDDAKALARNAALWKGILGNQGSISATPAPTATFANILRGVGASFAATKAGIQQAGSDFFNWLVPDSRIGGMPGETREQRIARNQIGARFRLRETQQAQMNVAAATPAFQTSWGAGIYGGISSLIQQSPGLVASAVTANPAPALGWAGLTTGASGYGKYRARGATPGEAALGGAGEGAVEVATELLPMGKFVEAFGAAGAKGFLTKTLASVALDVPGEQIATLAQDAIDTAIANPTKTWADYANERGDAAVQTLVATLVQGGLTAAPGLAAHTLIERTRARQAEVDAEFLQNAADGAVESKVRERSPSAFAKFLAMQSEGTPLEKLYIPAEAVASYMQEGGMDWHDPNNPFSFDPDFGNQVDSALATGGDVVVNTADYIAHLAGTPTWDALAEHLRGSADGMSLSEARTYEEEHAELMERRGAEAAEADQARAEALKPSSRVYDAIFSQAREAGFNARTAGAYAATWTARYQARAAANPGLGNAWDAYRASNVSIRQELPASVEMYRQADNLDLVINTMQRGKETRETRESLLEFLARRGGLDDDGGELVHMGADKWHTEKRFRKKLIRRTSGQVAADKAQGGLVAGDYSFNVNTLESAFDAAVSQGYFPDLYARREQASTYGEMLDIGDFLDAIRDELHGTLRFAEEREGAQAGLQEAADDLATILAQRGLDPATATRAEIEAAIEQERREAATSYAQAAAFYSGLERAVEGVKAERAPAAQWIATLKNAPGVKAEELQWSGLLDWLGMQTGPVDKAAVLDTVRNGGIKIEEVVNEAARLNEESEYYSPAIAKAVREYNASDVQMVAEALENDAMAYSEINSQAEEFGLADEDGELVDGWAMIVAEDLFQGGGGVQFQEYSSDMGSDSYKELLITLPPGEGGNPEEHPETHFFEPAVVAHARFMDKEGPDGERVLFVEEVQSDWHQKARGAVKEAKKSYDNALETYGPESGITKEALAKWEAAKAAGGYKLAPDPEVLARANADREAAIAAADKALTDLISEYDRYLDDQTKGMRDRLEIWRGRGLTDEQIRDEMGGSLEDEIAEIEESRQFERSQGQMSRLRIINRDLNVMSVRDKALDDAADAYRRAALRVEEARMAVNNAEDVNGIPDAPFKKTWPDLVMKRIIVWAATNGYDSVAWVKEGQNNGGKTNDNVGWFYERDLVNVVAKLIKPFGGKVERLKVGGMVSSQAEREASRLQQAEETIARFKALPPEEQARFRNANGEWLVSRFQMEEMNAQNAWSAATRAIREAGNAGREDNMQRGMALHREAQSETDPRKRAEMIAEARRLRESPGGGVDPALVEAERTAADTYNRAAMDTIQARGFASSYSVRDELTRRGVSSETAGQPGFRITPELREAAKGGFALFQGERGRIDIFADGSKIIRLFEGRDLSTLLHEGGHLWLEELRADALDPASSDKVREDWATVTAWFAANGHPLQDGAIPVEAHELFARGMERYFLEGKAPTPELAGAFQAFRSWLLRLYLVVKDALTNPRTGANYGAAPITPEIREVFDRLLATEEAIADAESVMESRAIPQADLAMTDAEYAAYSEAIGRTRTEAFDALLYRTMETVRRARTADWKRERASVRASVEREIAGRPEFRALAILRGKGDVERVALSRAAVVEIIGEEALRLIPKGVPPTVVEEGGVRPGVLAESVGLRSGEDLLMRLMGIQQRENELKAAGDKRSALGEAIDLETDRLMQLRHGDPLNDGTIEEEALAAIHSDMRATVIASELRALGKRSGDVATPYRVAREWAERSVREGRIADTLSGAALAQHRRNELKAQRAAERAILEGDVEEAFSQKQAQLLNHALWRATKDAKDDAEKIVARLSKLAKAKTLASMDQDYLDRIHDLLADYDFRPRTGRANAEREAFADWVAAREAAGEEVHVPPRLIGAERMNWSRMAYGDLAALDDTVASIAHLGRRKKKLLVAQEERAFEDVVRQAVEAADALPDLPVSRDRNPKPSRLKRIHAELVKVESIADDMDGHNPNGIFNKVLIWGATEAANKKSALTESVLKPLSDLYLGMDKRQRARLHERIEVEEFPNPETGEPTTFSRMELIAVALNTGNESNLDKMLRGEGWSLQVVEGVLNRELEEADWRFVQGVWDSIDTLWPDIARTERELTGVVPEKIEPRIVNTPFGPLRGGYYPVVYDPNHARTPDYIREAASTDAERFFGQHGRGVSTPKGHTIERSEAAGPLLYSVEAVLFNHVNRVTTRIAYGRFIRDALKFTRDRRVRDAIRRKLGPELLDQIEPWLRRQVNEAAMNTRDLRGWEQAMRSFRINATLVGLGFRATTMLAQTAGLANSAALIGGKWVAAGAAEFASMRGDAKALVFEASPELARRAQEFDRDVAASFQAMKGESSRLDAARSMAFWGIGMIDVHMVAIPTWLGAYRKGLSEGMTEFEAARYGDKIVRLSQSAGRAKDLAALQDANEGFRILTMFYSYFNALYQQQRMAVRAALRGDYRKAAQISFYTMILAPILSALFTGDWPSDEEEWPEWAMHRVFFGLWASVPLVREFASAGQQFSSGKARDMKDALDRADQPAVRALVSLGSLMDSFYKAASGDELPKRWLKNAIETPGYFVGLPTGQVGASVDYLYGVASGEQHPEDAGDVAYGLMKGRQRDQE